MKSKVVYHVISFKKSQRYLSTGVIKPPVRAWLTPEAAAQFSKQTGRVIILRLKFPVKDMKLLKGHRGLAVYIDKPYPIREWLMSQNIQRSVNHELQKETG